MACIHWRSAFDSVRPGVELGALLDTHPAAAELYENTVYQHAGLCRSPLDPALAAERQARQQRDIARAALGSAIADGLCRGEIEARHEVGAMLLGRANCPERRRAGGGVGAYFGGSEQSETMRSHGDTIVM